MQGKSEVNFTKRLRANPYQAKEKLIVMNLKRDHAMQEQASSSEWADKC